MNLSNHNAKWQRIIRGRESRLHRAGKVALGLLLATHGFLVLFEVMLADLLAFCPSGNVVRCVCGQHDLRIHTVRPNVRRDFANGCASCIILVPDDAARAAVRRRLRQDFPRVVWTRVGILTHADCCRQLLKQPDHTLATLATALGVSPDAWRPLLQTKPRNPKERTQHAKVN